MPWATNGRIQHSAMLGLLNADLIKPVVTACGTTYYWPPLVHSRPFDRVPICKKPACQSAYAAWKEGEGK